VTQDGHAQEVPVEGHGGGPVGNLEDEVKSPSFQRHLVIYTDVTDDVIFLTFQF